MVSEDVIHDAISPLIEKFHPQRIILFGSQARGTAHEKSDVDVLVVSRFQGKRRVILVEMDRTLRGVGLPLELVLLTPEEFDRDRSIPGTVARPAWLEGKVLYERT